jgi:hypothetical protein
MEKIIELATEDDIVAIRSKLEMSDARRVLMVVPGGNETLRSLVNIKLLARSADKLNIQLALITVNARMRDMAREAGLKTYSSKWWAQRTGFVGGAAKKAEPAESLPPQLHVLETPTPPRVRIEGKKLVLVVGNERVSIWQHLLSIVLIGLLGLAVVLLVFTLAPKAKVTVTPQVEVISTELTVTADPAPEVTGIDAENNLIPARPVQVELTLFAEIPTIDKEAAPTDFATGSVVFFNRTQDEQIIPISTTLRTSSGVPIEFMTTQTTTIPAGTGATTSMAVIAVEPGPTGNVPSGQINRFVNPTQGLLARVINEAPTFGGAVRQAGVVTEDDKDRLRSTLRQLIQQQGYEMMLAELDEQEFLPPETLQTIELDLTFDKFSGDIAETFGGEMRAVVRATAVGDYNANQLAYYALLASVPDQKRLLPNGLRFSAGGIEAIQDRAVAFPVMAQGIVVSEVDIDQIREAITFMPIGEAQAWISENQPTVSVPGIEVEPGWLGRMPLFSFLIEVEVVDVVPLIFGETAEAGP